MMHNSNGRRLAHRLFVSSASLTLVAAFAATPAKAIVIENVTIDNSYGYVIGDQPAVGPQPGGSTQSSFVGLRSPGAQAELGLNYNATADKDGFFFLHDHYCVGVCSTVSSTQITFDLFNDGDGREATRFDSQITPGHLARIFGEGRKFGSFDFTVTQVIGDQTIELYHASGNVGPESISLDTGGLAYNGLTHTVDPSGKFEVYDWGTTNLNLPLNVISGFQRSQLIYTATYQTTVLATCPDVTDCAGVEVAFGDPRNNGGVINISDSADLKDVDLNAVELTRPVIGGLYDPVLVKYAFVPQGSDLPPPPDAAPHSTYNRLFQSNVLAVPEPASWAMMLGGFGIIGTAIRRRRKDRLAAA